MKNGLRFLDTDEQVPFQVCDILDKEDGVYNYVSYMLDRTVQMFEYSGLPETIPDYILELQLQVYGSLCGFEHNGDLYIMRGRMGGAPDPYYRRTEMVVANPALNLSETFRIVNHLPPFEKNEWSSHPPCVLFRNDNRMRGLLPVFTRYATELVENDVSIRCAQINIRQQSLIVASTGPEIEAADKYIKSLESGKLSNVATRPFLDGVSVSNVGTNASNTIIQLIELQQYLKASWFNELGLNTNFNMKREYMSEEEIAVNTDILLPLVDDMLTSREHAIDAFNKEFGTSISVSKNSAWINKEKEKELSMNQKLNEGDSSEEVSENAPSNESM